MLRKNGVATLDLTITLLSINKAMSSKSNLANDQFKIV